MALDVRDRYVSTRLRVGGIVACLPSTPVVFITCIRNKDRGFQSEKCLVTDMSTALHDPLFHSDAGSVTPVCVGDDDCVGSGSGTPTSCCQITSVLSCVATAN